MTQELLDGYVASIVFAFLFALTTSWVAWRNGFFSIPKSEAKSQAVITWKEVLWGFLIFLILQLFVVQLLVFGWYAWHTEKFVLDKDFTLDVGQRGWANILGIGLSFVVLMGYNFFLPSGKRQAIWNKNQGVVLDQAKGFLVGVLSWLVSYPITLTVGQIIAFLIFIFLGHTPGEQLVVRQLKSIMDNPLLFASMLIAIVTIVPIIEEFLFRGLLQSWLTRKMGLVKGIALTSLIFASFHLSSIQGWENVELLISLFILSCFLGYVYVRQGTLWAPIGLHAIFNAISILLFLYVK